MEKIAVPKPNAVESLGSFQQVFDEYPEILGRPEFAPKAHVYQAPESLETDGTRPDAIRNLARVNKV